MDIVFSAYGPFGAPICSALGGEGGAVVCRGDGRAPGVLTDCTNCTTPCGRVASARDRQRRDHRKTNFYLLGGAVGAGGGVCLGGGADGRSWSPTSSNAKLVICLVQSVRRARPSVQRCGSQLASRRRPTTAYGRVTPNVVPSHISDRTRIIPAAGRACFPFRVVEAIGARG